MPLSMHAGAAWLQAAHIYTTRLGVSPLFHSSVQDASHLYSHAWCADVGPYYNVALVTGARQVV
eukprot:654000-Pleurochrysis_carterae.AAC.1